VRRVQGSTSTSTPSSPWPSKWDRRSSRVLSRRFFAINSSALVITSSVLDASESVLWPRPHEPYKFVAGPSATTNRCVIARRVDGIFFPLRPSLRLDSHNVSPTILGKVVRAAIRATSFAAAAESLADEAEVQVSERQVGRIAHEVGEQLRRDRDQRVEDFRDRKGNHEAPVVPRLAVVSVDGGRLQTRSDEPRQGVGVHDPAWREDKIADLVTMTTQGHDHDPHPDLPRCFTKKHEVVELVQGVTGQGALADVVEPADDEAKPLTVFALAETNAPPDGQPKPLVRTCVASLESSDVFGPMVAGEAQRRNFFAAQLRAFLGDGGAWIWTLHRTYFSTFEPIVDFVHVLTHVYLAARAVGGSAATIWERYLSWATACWQGRVTDVVQALSVNLEAMPPPQDGQEPKPTDPCEVIRLTIGYLTNNQTRMDYPRYRQEGLPTCSGMVESLVKQFNRRVKGTEKFWNPAQAESILQLRAAYLCEDDRLAKHFRTRPISPFRTYETTKRRKAG
jgi:hypothetical protein